MTLKTKIDGFALVYQPTFEEPRNKSGRRVISFGGLSRTVIQANDMPDYLQKAVMKFLEERHKNVEFVFKGSEAA